MVIIIINSIVIRGRRGILEEEEELKGKCIECLQCTIIFFLALIATHGGGCSLHTTHSTDKQTEARKTVTHPESHSEDSGKSRF